MVEGEEELRKKERGEGEGGWPDAFGGKKRVWGDPRRAQGG